jgi:hypothetical protein
MVFPRLRLPLRQRLRKKQTSPLYAFQPPGCVFRRSVTDRFGIVTAEFGNVTGHFGDVTD